MVEVEKWGEVELNFKIIHSIQILSISFRPVENTEFLMGISMLLP